MKKLIDVYLEFLVYDKNISRNTVESYRRDLTAMIDYLECNGIRSYNEVTYAVLMDFIGMLKENGKANATLSRHIAVIRGFFTYIETQRIIQNNPAHRLKANKADIVQPAYLTEEEIRRFLELPDDSLKGKRDRAMFELLYATGIKATELVNLSLQDVNIPLSYVSCHDDKSSRVIPLNKTACFFVKQYIDDVRRILLEHPTMDNKSFTKQPLFVNLKGGSMTRQGFWKIVKSYGELACFDQLVTPDMLRHSFACHLVQHGADLKSVQELMGHKSILSTQAYSNIKEQRLKDVYNRSHPRD